MNQKEARIIISECLVGEIEDPDVTTTQAWKKASC